MKKKRLMIVIACIVLFGIVMAAFPLAMGKKPYKNLDAAQIVSAKVSLTPPGKAAEIEDISALVDYLHDVVIYNRDNSYTEYAGQSVVFTLTMTDGTKTDIMAYPPFLVIDGVGYQTKYGPCEELNRYANELLNSENILTLHTFYNAVLPARSPGRIPPAQKSVSRAFPSFAVPIRKPAADTRGSIFPADNRTDTKSGVPGKASPY